MGRFSDGMAHGLSIVCVLSEAIYNQILNVSWVYDELSEELTKHSKYGYIFCLLARSGSQLANTLKFFYFILQKSKGKRITAKVLKSTVSWKEEVKEHAMHHSFKVGLGVGGEKFREKLGGKSKSLFL